MEETQQWYLMKREDGSIFGPIDFQQLYQWAHDAQVSAFDMVSNDQVQWIKAPMLPELGMDFIVEVGPDQYYGPTTLGALAEFMRAGEIKQDSVIINCKSSENFQAKDFPELQPSPEQEPQPVRTSTRVSLQKRVRELEEIILDERRMLADLERRCEQLEALLAQSGIEVPE
jgi:hypothetical protein